MKFFSILPAPRTMRGRLVTLLCVAAVPMLLVIFGMGYRWLQIQYQTEYEANIELARAIGLAFKEYVSDVTRQEKVVGSALVRLKPYSSEQARYLLTESREEFVSVKRFSWANSAGLIIASSTPQLLGFDIANRPFYRELLKGKEIVLSDLIQSQFDSTSIVIFARGIFNDIGKLEGIVLATIDPEKLWGITLNLPRSKKGLVSLFDSQGNLVSASIGEALNKNIRRNWSGADTLLQGALKGKERIGIIRSPVDRKNWVSAKIPISGTGWVAGASCPQSEVIRPVMQGWALAGGAVLLVMVFSLGSSLGISRTLVRSLEGLRQHALCVGRGECRVTDEVAGTVEFQELKQRAEEVEASNERLKKESLELTRSNKDLEDFAYVSSHDLQEPLRMVTGYLELLQRRYKDKLDADADEFIAYAVDGANRMQRLIIDLLAYSRVGSKGMQPIRVDLQEPLDKAVFNLKTAIESSGARVTHDRMPLVDADPSRMTQVFQNLIGNAIKFCKAASPRIHIGSTYESGAWRISVGDNGIGIEEQYLERIFGIFQRLHSRGEYPGSGIGLAICKRIIERHGGRIWAQSEPGHGSTFYFTIKG